MIGWGWRLSRPLLSRLDPETAHEVTLRILEQLPRGAPAADDPLLATKLFGLSFANPVGLAAGFDKDCRVPDVMLKLGFGFVEVGTVTPRPQQGNPRPRLFRLEQHGAIINRFGFNNQGHTPTHRRLRARLGRPGLVGVNIGANKDSADRGADYVAGIRRFADIADFFVVNVSSPNTAGLRDLQARDALEELLERVVAARDEAATDEPRRPVLLKIAPDLSPHGMDDVAEACLKCGVDGLVVGNTTLERPLATPHPAASESGGLSGKPLFRRATWVLAEMFGRVGHKLPLVGVGGIDSGADALAKIHAGASLLQLYSALVYRGPPLVAEIKASLTAAIEKDGPLAGQTGRDAEAVAREGP